MAADATSIFQWIRVSSNYTAAGIRHETIVQSEFVAANRNFRIFCLNQQRLPDGSRGDQPLNRCFHQPPMKIELCILTGFSNCNVYCVTFSIVDVLWNFAAPM
jgi:hypothetical protein